MEEVISTHEKIRRKERRAKSPRWEPGNSQKNKQHGREWGKSNGVMINVRIGGTIR